MSILSSIGNAINTGYNDVASVFNPTVAPGGYIGPSPTPGAAAPVPRPPAPTPTPTTPPKAPAVTTPATPATPAGPTAAQLAAQANYNNLYNTDQSLINTNIGSSAATYNQGILDAFQGSGGFGSQQNTLNADAVQNELSKAQGLQGVRDMVNNGIQGGGVVLANDNAGTSSAADALARAYGVQGRQQASQVGSQYVQGQNTIANNQTNLTNAENNFVNVDTPATKQKAINDITQSAGQALTYLNLVAGQTANPAQLGNIQAQIADVKARATAALSQYDNQLATQMGANAPTSQDANQAKAQGLLTQGVAPAQEFNFTSTAPATLQGTGPAASNLPIYIAPSQKNNLPALA